MPISTVIVDDEKLARDELAYLLESFPDVQIVAQGQNGYEAVRLVRQLQPDLMFLDAQMPGLDGFGTVKMLEAKKLPLPLLVFATAYDQYALKAFEINAVDYLLKPFDKGRLGKTLARIERRLSTGETVATKIDRVIDMLDKKGGQPVKVLMRSGGRQLLLDPDEIVFARIDAGVITIATRQFEGQSAFRTIEDLQASLDASIFWRAHRSYLINLNHIKEVVPWFNSSFQLRMDDRKQSEIPVSRMQSRHLRELYRL